MSRISEIGERIGTDGFAVLPSVFAAANVDAILASLDAAFKMRPEETSIRSDAGSIYAARNVLTLWPEAATVWREPSLPEALNAVLGSDFGLVRALYFDKPPDRTWALPWHKDLTIAVKEHRPSQLFTHPTRKAGVPHVEAPAEVLQQMLTMRIHLDDMTAENGPLNVIPGSHRTGKKLQLGDTPPTAITGERGDVLLMRPLLAHNSGPSHPETIRHRRVLHLEFAGTAELADGFAWHTFMPGADSGESGILH
jgi:hypothetical protein